MQITRIHNTYSSQWEEQQAKQIQALVDSFVAIRSEQLEDLISAESFHSEKAPNPEWLKQYVLEILVKNDNLYTVADYVRQGETEYYWYSDFLDNLEKKDKKKYTFYETSNITVSKSRFDKSFNTVDLPYFKEVVELVSALKAIERLEPEKNEGIESPEEK